MLSHISDKRLLLRDFSLVLLMGNIVYYLFSFPPIVWRVSYVCLCLFVFLFRFNATIHISRIEKRILFFVSMNFIYFIFALMWSNPSLTQIGNILYALLTFSLFYYIGRQSRVSQRFINVSIVLLVIASVLAYNYAKNMLIQELDLDENVMATVNASTSFLFLLPALFLVNKKWLKFILLCICMYFILISAKRGNILASIIPSFFLVYSFMKGLHSLIHKGLVLVVLGFTIFQAYRISIENEYLMLRLEQTEEGNMSRRDIIYPAAWHQWFDSDDVVNILFGFGTDATVSLLPTKSHAHNDWLELLVNNGFMGFTLYLLIFIEMIRLIWKYRNNWTYRIYLLSVFIVWFMKTIYSMGYTDERLSLLLMYYALLLGFLERNTGLVKTTRLISNR